MKKDEMEGHWAHYHDDLNRARDAERRGLFQEALVYAFSSWDHIDGMMQYARKHEDAEFESIEGIDIVLRYAPYLLDFRSLDRLEELLKTQRRIGRNTSECIADKLSEARRVLREAHRLWDQIEQHGPLRQDQVCEVLGGHQDQWNSTAENWEKMGLLHRTGERGSFRLSLATRMGAVVPAKCPSCGAATEAPKAMLLEELRCPECQVTVFFVLLPAVGATIERD